MRRVVDVSHLPTYAFGSRATTWWGLLGLVAAEGAMFALLLVTYLYLRSLSPDWPPGVFPPALLWGSVTTGIMIASVLPNYFVKKAAHRMDVRGVQLGLVVMLAFAVAISIVRIFEFRSLNVWWDENAYGSIVWTLLGFHTLHLLTDLFDTAVLMVLMFTGPLEEKHFVDGAENAGYWDFVVVAWMPIYALIYLYPRFA
jgi:heme/copper-type cytochrome/quinol oxidase subunit 3